MAQEKTYKVVSDFNDASGKAWKSGQTYTGSPQEVQSQLQQGHIVEDTSSQSGQQGQQGQQGQRQGQGQQGQR